MARRACASPSENGPSQEIVDADREAWTDIPPVGYANDQGRQPAYDPPEPSHRPANVWQMALDELALSMPAPTFETWVRDTSVMGYEDGEFVIGVPHAYARDWLQNRLRPQIKRVLSRLLQRSTEVTFRVRPRPVSSPEQGEIPALYQTPGDAERDATPGFPLSPGDEAPREQRLDEALLLDASPADGPPSTGGRPRRSLDWGGQQPRPASRRPRVEMSSAPLNPHYTFDSFIVGSHNRLAHAAALSVADHPGYRFNPLFVYGGVGLGKTHLLHAIGHQMMGKGMQILYCSSEQFTNELISAIRS